MARYCGDCGSSLGPDAFYSGRCPVCGARIDASNRVQDLSDISSADNPTQAARDYVAPDQHPNRRRSGRQSKATRTRQSNSAMWVITVILALALLLAGAAILTLAPNRLSFFTSSNASANSSSGGTGTSTASSSTSVSGPGAVATTTATGQPGPTPPPNGSTPGPSGPTPTPPATPVATAVTVAPELSVSPTSISSLICLGPIGGSATITVANTGGGEMSWSASASHYSITPGSGTLHAGTEQNVIVSGIGQSGTVTFTAAGSSNSPQQVSIHCTL